MNIPAVHTIRVKKAGEYGASISMNMAMSLRTSAKSLVRKEKTELNTSHGFMMTRLIFFKFMHAYLHFLASESSLVLEQRQKKSDYREEFPSVKEEQK